MAKRAPIIICSLFALVFGCAEGTSNTDNGEDDLQMDISVDDGQDDGGDVLDMAEDETTADVPTDNRICTPDETRCDTAGNAVETCNLDGTAWESDECGATEMCDGGTCVAMMVCMPDSVECTDYKTLTRCSSSGATQIPTDCSPGRCIDLTCTTGTKDTGEPCTTADECAGQSCQCSENQCPGTPLEDGYCTTSQCDEHGCSPDELCVNFGLGNRTSTQDCILNCDDCVRTGFSCRELPSGTGADVTWASGCYQSDYPRGVGQACTADEDCIGGLCLTTSPGGDTIDMGYCSAPCETQSNCPSNAACIKVTDFLDDGGFCAVSCIDVSGSLECPPERPSTFDIDCIVRAAADGGPPEQVCFQL